MHLYVSLNPQTLSHIRFKSEISSDIETLVYSLESSFYVT